MMAVQLNIKFGKTELMDATVEHYKIIDGEHSWPGAFFQTETIMDINALQKKFGSSFQNMILTE